MKLVIISDIHGNFAALESLRETWDELWVVGDLVNYGPRPKEVIAWVRRHAHLVVRGNHDHAIGLAADPRCSAPYKRMAAETSEYTNASLTEEEKSYLERLPLSAQRRLGSTSFYVCHATPSDPLFGYRSVDDPGWLNEVNSTGSDVVVVGHTHIPVIHRYGARVLMNPGSLGQPKTGAPDACYGVWDDGKFELRRYAYPVAQTEMEIRQMAISHEIQEDLIFSLRTGGILRGGGK